MVGGQEQGELCARPRHLQVAEKCVEADLSRHRRLENIGVLATSSRREHQFSGFFSDLLEVACCVAGRFYDPVAT